MSNSAKSAYLIYLAFILASAFYTSSSYFPRELIYKSSTLMTKGAADVEFLHHLIFEEKGPIDLLVIGQSQVWAGLISSKIQQDLNNGFHKNYVVRTMAHNWCGHDFQFVLLTDLLARRQVRNIIIASSPCEHLRSLHEALFEIWPQTLFTGPGSRISLWSQLAIRLYESPRKLLSLIREDSTSSGASVMPGDFPNPDPIYGNLEVFRQMAAGRFSRIAPRMPASGHEDGIIKFDQKDDDVYLEKIHNLLTSNAVSIGWLSTFDMGRDDSVHLPSVASRWPSDFHLGISSKCLFSGYSDKELDYLFYNKQHFNSNGARLWTQIIGAQIVQSMRSRNEKF